MELNNSLTYLQDQVNCHKQTMNIYRELEAMKFGLKELKQLWNTILEIAEANDISYEEAVSKFIKDVEKNYDDKLEFEKKVKETKDELALMNNKVINCCTIIQLQPSVGPALSNLLQKGMVEQNIIDIHHLVETLNNTDISNKNENTKNKISRSEYWKIFTDDLKRCGDIKVAIKEQQAIYEKIYKEINYLNEQKQEISKYIQTAIFFINILNNEISYYKGRLDHFKNLNNRINLPSSFLQPFVFIVFKDKGKDAEDHEENSDDNGSKRK